jgi:hypothetical protein
MAMALVTDEKQGRQRRAGLGFEAGRRASRECDQRQTRRGSRGRSQARSWDEVKPLCKAFAQTLVRAEPAKYVATISKAARKGKVLLDYLRNGRGATAVCAYSTRARPLASVALPIAWSELTGELRPDQFTLQNVPERLSILDDPWRDFGKRRPKLTTSVQRALANERARVPSRATKLRHR